MKAILLGFIIVWAASLSVIDARGEVRTFGRAILHPALGGDVAGSGDASEIKQKRESALLKFEFLRNTSLVLVPVFINNSGPFKFLLDTGATNSILSAALAEKLNIPPGRTESLATAAGPLTVTVRTFDALRIGGIQIDRPEIVVADLTLLGNLRVDGVLGGDYLKSFSVSIDYSKKLVRIERRG